MPERTVGPGRPSTGRRFRRLVAAAALVVVGALGPSPIPVGADPPGSSPTRQVDDGPQLPVDPDADPAETRRTADEILADDAYQAPADEAPGGRSLLDRIREWFGDRLPDIQGPGSGATDGLSLVLVAAIAAGAVAVVIWVVRAGRRSRSAPDDIDDTDADIEITPLRSPSEWSEEADRCEAAGDHRAAVRARFRAVTATLVDRELVVDSPGRTTGELRLDLEERAPEAAAAFAPLAAHFERTWYGSATAGPDDSDRARALAQAALRAAPDRPSRLAEVVA